jgi:hypothetical protein
MTKLAGFIQEPVAYKGLHKRTLKKAVILHTNGAGVIGKSDEDLFGWWSSVAAGHQLPEVGTTIGAQLQIAMSGNGYQYVDTGLVVYHAFGASEWAAGFETEDDGNPNNPWSDAQINKIVAGLQAMKVPAQLLKEGPSDGVGWHQKYDSWNQHNHNCPGKVRVEQINDIIIPRLKEGSDMASSLNSNELGALAYVFGQKERTKGNPKPANGSYKGSDGGNYTNSAQLGWDDKDAEIAARPTP